MLDDVNLAYVLMRFDKLTKSQVFASVDVHTSRWIIEKCFRGDLVRGRTILLVVCLYLFSIETMD